MRALIMSFAVIAVCLEPATGQEASSKQIVDRLHAAPKPVGQSDINTLDLASARREKTDSMVERTNGLWQSWVVAICQGCGVQERRYSGADDGAVDERAKWRSRAEREPQLRQVKASKIVIRPFAMLEEGKPAIVMIGQRGIEP